MSQREWRSVTKADPCPACGKPDWCAWSRDGWLKCERSTDAPNGMVRVSIKGGGGVFKPIEWKASAGQVASSPRASTSTKSRIPSKKRDSVDKAVSQSGKRYRTADDAVAGVVRWKDTSHTGRWTYRNAAGEPVVVVVRIPEEPNPNAPNAKPPKSFVPVSLVEGGWIIGDPPKPLPLYHLPDLLATAAGSLVFIVEGEKTADAARAVGLVATTSAHGCGSAKNSDWSPLAGRDVVVLPDHDDAGEKYAGDVARLAMAAGANSVRIVRLVEIWAGMPKGGDMADLLEHRGGDGDSIRKEVEALVEKAEPEAVTLDALAVGVFKPFPVWVLPDPVRTFITEGARAIGCDPSMVALPLLAGLASAIGNTHRIELKRGWNEPPILWMVTVGESGAHKTPAFKLAMKAIRKVQDRAWKEHKAAMIEYQAEIHRYESKLREWNRQAGKATGDTSDPPIKPVAPIARRCIVSDTTTEALAPILLGNPRGVLLARDELSGWLGSFDQYKNRGKAGADSAHWLSMHNGEAMTIDRKTGIPPTIHVSSASVSITGGIQPGILERSLGQENHENGMLARLLFAMPPQGKKKWSEADVSAATEAALERVLDRLFGLNAEIDDEGDPQPVPVTMSEGAKRDWVTFYNAHAAEQHSLSGDLKAAWSKLEGYAARLALLIHLIRWAAGDESVPSPTTPMDAASIAAGVELARWFDEEARRVYGVLSESDEERDKRMLVELIVRKGGTISPRELFQSSRKYRPVEVAEAALHELVKDGWGAWEPPKRGESGRPAGGRFVLASFNSAGVYESANSQSESPTSVDVDSDDTPKADDAEGWGEVPA